VELLAPAVEPLAELLEVAGELRAAKHRAARDDQRLHLFPHAPWLPAAFEQNLFVEEAAVYDARDHFPITEHHAHVRVSLAAGRTDTHQLLLAFHVEVDRAPLPRFPQPRLTPVRKQTQSQTD